MTTATKTKPTKKRAREKAPRIAKKWLNLFALTPGYDPVATAEPGDWFDPTEAQLYLDFFEHPEDGCLRHIEGDTAGELFVLEPWERAIIACTFGWKRHDLKGRVVRRYREVFLYIPRGNGKTPLSAGMANAVFFIEKDRGKQVYCAAGDTEQANLLYRHAKGMVNQEPILSDRVQIYESYRSMVMGDDRASVFRVLSAEGETKHGMNPSAFFIDELHTQPNAVLVDALRTAMGKLSRTQPLAVYATTADFDRKSVCNLMHARACKIRDGEVKDSTFLPIIYEADRAADWTDEALWEKVNPNIDVTVSRAYLRTKCQEALEFPETENEFRRLHLCMKVEQQFRWMPMTAWDKCDGPVDTESLKLRPCFAGLDLASKHDSTALVLIWPAYRSDPICYVAPYFWIPENEAERRYRRDTVPFPQWGREGFFELIPGNVIDYNPVIERIKALRAMFGFKHLGFDAWDATHVSNELTKDNIDVMPMRQGAKTLSGPMKEVKRLVVGQLMAHAGNPPLRWQASNVVAEIDKNENVTPHKEKSPEQIDGIVALIMAMGVAMEFGSEKTASVYETRGLHML
jgi:phage terminase large subunit-like protein